MGREMNELNWTNRMRTKMIGPGQHFKNLFEASRLVSVDRSRLSLSLSRPFLALAAGVKTSRHELAAGPVAKIVEMLKGSNLRKTVGERWELDMKGLEYEPFCSLMLKGYWTPPKNKGDLTLTLKNTKIGCYISAWHSSSFLGTMNTSLGILYQQDVFTHQGFPFWADDFAGFSDDFVGDRYGWSVWSRWPSRS